MEVCWPGGGGVVRLSDHDPVDAVLRVPRGTRCLERADLELGDQQRRDRRPPPAMHQARRRGVASAQSASGHMSGKAMSPKRPIESTLPVESGTARTSAE